MHPHPLSNALNLLCWSVNWIWSYRTFIELFVTTIIGFNTNTPNIFNPQECWMFQSLFNCALSHYVWNYKKYSSTANRSSISSKFKLHIHGYPLCIENWNAIKRFISNTNEYFGLIQFCNSSIQQKKLITTQLFANYYQFQFVNAPHKSQWTAKSFYDSDWYSFFFLDYQQKIRTSSIQKPISFGSLTFLRWMHMRWNEIGCSEQCFSLDNNCFLCNDLLLAQT